jgi:hypothetical protein
MRPLFTLVFLLACTSAFAQKLTGRGTVRGAVVDSASGKPLREASVSLLAARDSAYVTFGITDGDGRFLLRNLPNGRYRLLVTFVGFQNASRSVVITPDEPTADLGTLALHPQATLLNEVVVKQESAPIAVKGDTIVFNANSFKTQPNAVVEDLLKKLPGVEVARDGTVKAQGQNVSRVLVDGKPFFGDDPKMATRNLPADLIDKVQVYDQQSDQAAFSGIDDGNREKTINLTIKRDRKKGYFGQNSLGAGTDGRYQGRLGLNRFNNGRQISLLGMGNNLNQQGFTMQDGANFGGGGPGPGGGGFGGGGGQMVMAGPGGGRGGQGGNPNQQPSNITESLAGGLNYRDALGKRAEIAGSYFANRNVVTTEQQSRRENILPGQSFVNDQDLFSRNLTTNHRVNVRLDVKLDSLTSLRFVPTLSWLGNGLSSLTDQQISSQNRPLSRNQTDYGTDGTGFNGFGNLLLMRKFRREGRTLSLNYNGLRFGQNTTGLNRATNEFFAPQTGSPARTDRLNQRFLQDAHAANNTLTLSFVEPLSLSRKVEFRYGYLANGNRSERETADFNEATGRYDRFNAPLSNRFRSDFDAHRAGLTVQTRRLRYTYGLGFDLQQATLRADNRSVDTTLRRSFTNLLPVASFSYNWVRNRTLRLNYRTRINPPSGTQLQPVPDNSNPLNVRLGNPALKPEFYHTLLATFNQFSVGGRSVFAFLNLNAVERRIVNATAFSPTGAQTTQPVNTDGYWAGNGFFSYGNRLKALKLNANLTTNADFSRGVSFVNGRENVSKNWGLGQGASVNSVFNGKFEFSLAANVTFQLARFSLQPEQNTEFFTKTLTGDLFWQLPGRFVLTSEVYAVSNSGRSAGFNQRFALWNLALARQFWDKRGELRLQAYDVLNQNRSLVRNVTETYVEDVRSRVLQRYFLLSFHYNLRKFGV